eukprot:635838-Amphidinium_carterae.1
MPPTTITIQNNTDSDHANDPFSCDSNDYNCNSQILNILIHRKVGSRVDKQANACMKHTTD